MENERQFRDFIEHMHSGVIVADLIQAADGTPTGFRLVKGNPSARNWSRSAAPRGSAQPLAGTQRTRASRVVTAKSRPRERHGCAAPVRCIGWPFLGRLLEDLLALIRNDPGLPTSARLLMLDPIKPCRFPPPGPLPSGPVIAVQGPCNGSEGFTHREAEDDFRPQNLAGSQRTAHRPERPTPRPHPLRLSEGSWMGFTEVMKNVSWVPTQTTQGRSTPLRN
jgi:hypothetical protein